MGLEKIILLNYNITPIHITKTQSGSGNTAIVKSEDATYLVKWNERADFVAIINRTQHFLNSVGIKQNKIIKTVNQELKTDDGIVLYEYCEGVQYKELNFSQIEHTIKYLKTYNDNLKKIVFKEDDIQVINYWDLAKSIDFMTNQFPKKLSLFELSYYQQELLLKAIEIIQINKETLSKDRQLIHGDLGQDNILFKGDEVICFIDFTPEYNHELYSLCQFLYWNVLWLNQDVNEEGLNRYLSLYSNNYNPELFHYLLLEACLFRLIGPMMELLNRGEKTVLQLNKRFMILKTILSLQFNR